MGTSELAQAGAVTEASYRVFYQDLGPWAEVFPSYAPQLRDVARRADEAEVLVAVARGGDLIGTVTFCRAGSPWQEIAAEGEAELRMLAVLPALQRLGVGRALTQACIDRARLLGSRALVLSTPALATPPQRLYEGLGFRRVPLRDWKPEPGLGLLAYAKALN